MTYCTHEQTVFKTGVKSPEAKQASSLGAMSPFIKVSGTKLIDADGKEIILRGAGLGGWMK